MNSRTRRLCLLVGLPFALALPLSAQPEAAPADDRDEGVTFIDELYGERIEAAQQTRAADDDLALMREMLEIAPTLPVEPDARAALYLRMVEMAGKTKAGYGLAIDALHALAGHDPDHPSATPQALLDVYESWYRSAERDERAEAAGPYFDQLIVFADAALDAGDHASAKRWYSDAASVQRVARLERAFDLRTKLVEVRAVEQAAEDLRRLKAAAERGPLTPAQARRLVVLLVLEAGEPAAATEYVAGTGDAEFRDGLDAAVAVSGMQAHADDADRPPRQWGVAGRWYAALADEAGLTDRARRRAFEQSRAMLRRFVDQTKQEDVEKARAVILLRQLDDRYAELYGEPVDPNDVMSLLDPVKHMIAGRPFTIDEGRLAIDSGAILHLPVAGGDHYALTLKLELAEPRKSGLQVWLPVAGRMARLFIDITDIRGSKVDGLAYIDDDAGVIRLAQGQPATLRVEVRSLPDNEAAIQLTFNGRAVWQWRGDASKFTDPPYGKPPDRRHFALRVDTDALIHRIALEKLGGGEDNE